MSKSPFPGMDPYLERYWGDVHVRLSLYACDQIGAQLPRGLVARVEEYLAVETDAPDDRHGYYPDVHVAEESLVGSAGSVAVAAAPLNASEPLELLMPSEPPTLRAIRVYDPDSGNRVVTAIEFLSPINKTRNQAIDDYRTKQRDFLAAGVSVVEIDLLREGTYVLIPPEDILPATVRTPYLICVIRGWRPRNVSIYSATFRAPLPRIRIPLRRTDVDVILDLQEVIDKCYVNGQYDRSINYREDARPALSGVDAEWADQLLREKGLR